MSSWRYVTTETPHDAYMNLAFEEAIPRARALRIVPNTLRLWTNADAVIVGYSQDAHEVVDLRACAEMNVQVVRRFTGGGAVYHDLGNLNFSVSFRGERPFVVQEFEARARLLCQGPLIALRNLGIECALDKLNSIMISDRKISGFAHSLRWGVFFFHGCVLLSSDVARLASVLKRPGDDLRKRGVPDTPHSVVTGEQLLGCKVTLGEAKNAFKEAFEEVLGAEMVLEDLSDYEAALASRLRTEKYSTPEWNLQGTSRSLDL